MKYIYIINSTVASTRSSGVTGVQELQECRSYRSAGVTGVQECRSYRSAGVTGVQECRSAGVQECRSADDTLNPLNPQKRGDV